MAVGDVVMVIGETSEESFVPFGHTHDETGRRVSQCQSTSRLDPALGENKKERKQ